MDSIELLLQTIQLGAKYSDLRLENVFLSHASEDKQYALSLQKCIQLACPFSTSIFASTDVKSIRTGEPWFESISKALRQTKALITLLSPESCENPWLAYEAGFAAGVGAELLLYYIKDLQRDRIRSPLGHLDVRVVDKEGFEGILRHLKEIFPVPRPFIRSPIIPRRPETVQNKKSTRLQQSHSGANGVFITHTPEDTKRASVLQKYIHKLFGSRRNVFASSDMSSLRTGASWLNRTSKILRDTKILIALISPSSAANPWVAFEVGLAVGMGTQVLTYSIKNLQPHKVRSPFAQMQVRAVDDENGFEDLVRQLKEILSVSGYLIVPKIAVHEWCDE